MTEEGFPRSDDGAPYVTLFGSEITVPEWVANWWDDLHDLTWWLGWLAGMVTAAAIFFFWFYLDLFV